MIRAVYEAAGMFGLSGALRDLACGAVLALAALLAIPVVGMVAGYLRSAAQRGIARLAGSGAAFAVMNYLTFPGVIVHELAHALVAKAMGCRIDEVELFRPSGDSLGYVRFTCRGSRGKMSLQAAAASCAPVFIGFFAIRALAALAARFSAYWGAGIVLYHAAFSVACHMTMSGQDLKNYAKGCVRLFLYLTLAGFVLFYVYGKMASRG